MAADDLKDNWWDGYKGQRTVVIDDWHPGLCSLSRMIKYMGSEKKRLNIKTSHTWAQYTTLIITSNTTYPEDCYRNIRQSRRETFFRRVNVVKHFTEQWVESTPTVEISSADQAAMETEFTAEEGAAAFAALPPVERPALVRQNAFVFDTTTE